MITFAKRLFVDNYVILSIHLDERPVHIDLGVDHLRTTYTMKIVS